MEFQGGTIEGYNYGALSPLDFTGLHRWHKSTNGIEFAGGSNIARWKDLSGNGLHLNAYNVNSANVNPRASYGRLIQTPYGLAVQGSASDIWLASLDDHKFQYDGSAFSVILVYRNITTGSVSLTVTRGYNRFTYAPSGNNIAIRIEAMPSLDVPLNAAATSYISIVQNYGYQSQTPNATVEVNGVMSNQKDYNAVPSNNPSADYWSIRNASNSFLYEIIIYNQTGKTRDQQQAEISRLYSDYLTPNYRF
jgi:hypothetical protein